MFKSYGKGAYFVKSTPGHADSPTFGEGPRPALVGDAGLSPLTQNIYQTPVQSRELSRDCQHPQF
mgnify:CR=1 FL=1